MLNKTKTQRNIIHILYVLIYQLNYYRQFQLRLQRNTKIIYLYFDYWGFLRLYVLKEDKNSQKLTNERKREKNYSPIYYYCSSMGFLILYSISFFWLYLRFDL